ncbi:unnamed protein product [Ectocarpus sp. 12 AP-2014]
MDGFTRTWRCMDRLNVQDELVQDLTDPNFVLRNVDLAFSCCGQTPAVEEGYLRRKEVQRLVCSQCMFVAGFLLPMFKQMTGIDKKSKRMAVGGPLIGIIGAGGQLGSAIAQTFLDYGWKPFRLAVSGRGQKKLRKFEALGVGVFEDVSLLVRAVRLVIVAVGPQHARQVGSTLGDNGTASALVMSTLAGISEGSLKRVLGTENLIQARVDIARLDVIEAMGSRGLRADGPTSRVGQAERSNSIKDQYDGDAVKEDSDDWGCGDIATWRAVHERAACHFIPHARAVGKIIDTIESFYVEQGLEPVQAHQACLDRLLPSVEPAALGTGSQQRANLPQTLSSPGKARSEHTVPLSQRESLTTTGNHDLDTRDSPRSPQEPENDRKSPSVTASKGAQPCQGEEPNAPPDNRLEAEQEGVGAPPHLGDETARPICDTPAGQKGVSHEKVRGCPISRDDADRMRAHGAWTAGAMMSTSSVGSCSSTATKQQQQQHQPKVHERGNNQMKEDGDKTGGERWTPQSNWPPPDLVLIEDAYEEMLRVPYGDAVRESGYQSGL